MQKITIRLIIFFLAFSIGLSVYFFWQFSVSRSVSETPTSPDNNFLESTSSRADDKRTAADFYNIAPCIDVNSFKKYKFSRKSPTMWRGVLNGLALCGSLPEYSKTVNNKDTFGAIKINVLIDETGEVMEVRAKSGNSSLRRAAEKAAYQTRFCPTLLGGESMKVKGVLIYQFDSERGFWLPKNFPIKDSEHKIILLKRAK